MSETEFTPMTEEEAQQRIANAFATLDAIYLLHAPKDPEAEFWICKHCNEEWPCDTERLILDGLGLTSGSPSEEQEPSA